jgi:hypothetical protein
LESRLQPSVFFFGTDLPDGRIGTISEPPNTHNGRVEFETADDFVLNTETKITNASFVGLLTGGATLRDVDNVFITIYRVFPFDSDLTRTPKVPTRNNSPADNEIINRDSAANDLTFHSFLLADNFTTQFSVTSSDKIAVKSGGNGPATGEEVAFTLKFKDAFDLPAGHYFFVPKVGLKNRAPAGADFLWLSAPKPIQPPGTPFKQDLQSWMREDPGLAPDWLRVGADIIGGTTFNGSFALAGETGPDAISLRNSGPEAQDSRLANDSAALLHSLLDGTSLTDDSVPPNTFPSLDPVHRSKSMGLGNADTSVAPNSGQHFQNSFLNSSEPQHANPSDAAFTNWSNGFLTTLQGDVS